MKVQVGEKVVFPGCGVGTIEARETLHIGDEQVDAFRIGLAGDDATIWVPAGSLVEKGVRPVMDPKHVPRTWEILTSQTAPSKRRPWPQRRRRYTEMLMECTPASLARLLGELTAVRRKNLKTKKKKNLSFSEKKYFEQARTMLVAEIAAARGVDTEVVDERFEELTVVAAA